MKYVTCVVNDVEMFLLYSVGAMFELRQLCDDADKIKYIDEDGDECERQPSILDVINPTTVDGIEKLFKAAAVMAEQGELYRRYIGYKPEKIIQYKDLYDTIKPENYFKFKEAVFTAVVLGHQREIEAEHVDLAMEELARQKDTRPGLSTYLAVGASLGMTQKEVLFERPGMIEDIIAVKNPVRTPALQEGAE